MRNLLLSFGLLAAGSAGAQNATVSVAAPHTFEFGISGGYFNGLSGELAFTMRNLGMTNLGLRTTVAYTNIDGFKDNAVVATDPDTNAPITAGQLFSALGFPNESNSNVTIGLDGLFHLSYDASTGLGFNGYVGGRYNLFSTTRSGAGGSTTFSSNQFGIGAGLIASYPIAPNVYLTGDVGLDYYLPAPIRQCSSDGTCQTFNANDAQTRAYINTPSTVVKARVGLGVRF